MLVQTICRLYKANLLRSCEKAANSISGANVERVQIKRRKSSFSAFSQDSQLGRLYEAV